MAEKERQFSQSDYSIYINQYQSRILLNIDGKTELVSRNCEENYLYFDNQHFSSQCFVKHIENIFSVFLSSYTQKHPQKKVCDNSKEMCKYPPMTRGLTVILFLVNPNFYRSFHNSLEKRFLSVKYRSDRKYSGLYSRSSLTVAILTHGLGLAGQYVVRTQKTSSDVSNICNGVAYFK